MRKYCNTLLEKAKKNWIFICQMIFHKRMRIYFFFCCCYSLCYWRFHFATLHLLCSVAIHWTRQTIETWIFIDLLTNDIDYTRTWISKFLFFHVVTTFCSFLEMFQKFHEGKQRKRNDFWPQIFYVYAWCNYTRKEKLK